MVLEQELFWRIEKLREKLVLIKDLGKPGLLDLYHSTLHQFGLVLQKSSYPLTDVEIKGEIFRNVSGGRVPAPMWKEFMTEVVKDLPILEWPSDPSDLEKYYEIPTIEIPQLIGLNILDAEEIAFSSYILPTINLVESEEAPGLVLTQDLENGEESLKELR
jgi:hypothetical protein